MLAAAPFPVAGTDARPPCAKGALADAADDDEEATGGDGGGGEEEGDTGEAEEEAATTSSSRLAQQLALPSLTHAPVPAPPLLPSLDSSRFGQSGGESSLVPSSSSAFPPSAWHAALPATGLPSLVPWSREGLSDVARRRVEHLVCVYSLGWHQLIRAVRAGMVEPSATVASMWKLLVFLLNDCMPDGSVYSLRMASLEREQAARSRELLAAREAELARLLKLEASLQAQVAQLDQALRRVQAARQDKEDARLEATDSLAEQEQLQNAAAEDIAELEAQVKHWEARFRVASNRHRLLCEDVRQVTSQQHALRSAQYQLVNESAALDNEELRWVEAFDSLSHSLATAQERQRKLVAAQAVATRQAARAGDEAQQLAQQLVEAAARAGELASLALAKIRERMLVVKQVQAIKKELKEVVDVELSASTSVSALSSERTALRQSVDTLSRSANGLSFAAEQARSELAAMEVRAEQQRQALEQERQRLADMDVAYAAQQDAKALLQAELHSLATEGDADEALVREAEQKLARAMEAANSLTDSVRQATAENQRLGKELRLLSAHGAQLEADVELRSTDIATHDVRVAERKTNLEAEIARQEESIVSCGRRATQMQEDTVAAKQRLIDVGVAMHKSELHLEEVVAQVTAQEALVEGLVTSAAEKRAKRQEMEAELARMTELRATGRAALDLAHAGHAARMGAYEKDIADLQRQVAEKQEHTRLLQQRMVSASHERNAASSAHERLLSSLGDEARAAEEAKLNVERRQADWIAASQAEHADLHAQIQAANARLVAAREKRTTLEAARVAAEKKRKQERAALLDTDTLLEKARRNNAAQRAVVSSLSSQVSTAASLQANQVHDQQTLHHLLEYTLRTNAALAQRKYEYTAETEARAVAHSVGMQTPAMR